MKNSTPNSSRSKRHRYLAAVVLGTTLSALGTPAPVAAAASETTSRAVTDISRYCTTCWRNARLDPNSWEDCTQEVLCRLLERVSPDSWGRVLKMEGDERREFFRAIDTVKKRSQRQRRWAPQSVDQLADRDGWKEHELQQDRSIVREKAAELLSRRQEKILHMSLEGWSVHDIARELRVPPERVSDEKYKAVRKLRQYFSPEMEEMKML
jgi:RNA polymerase sigma factor (sigma-70 family)